MNPNNFTQCALFIGALLLLVKPLGLYMARVYEGVSPGIGIILGPVERGLYRVFGVRPDEEMSWKTYATAFMYFNAVGLLLVYGLQRFQHLLPLNPLGVIAVTPDSAFNTAVSFATNTNWQGYSGETTMSYLTQMAGLTVQNFLSAAGGMSVLVAFVRGFVRRQANTLGNFWVDMTRSTLYILLPLSVVLGLALVSQGVVQTFTPSVTVSPLQSGEQTTQVLAVGPAASQVAIKQLGTNGGGFFNANSAHPFENPTPLSNFLECVSILLIAAALCYSFGVWVGDRRQGWAVLAAMGILVLPFLWVSVVQEQRGNPLLSERGVDQAATADQPGGNMEGKEVRHGIAQSAIWATATTAASNGSVNAMHDSFTPLGGLAALALMQMGEVAFGGVGSGLYGMLLFAIVSVFIAGLMVGRTPEYLGKKIEAFEMKMASIGILIPCAVVLLGTAIAVVTKAGRLPIFNPGAHGFSEVLYAFTSAGNNNGSAFAGLGANTTFYNVLLGISMFFARYWIAIPVLALAGSLAKKKKVPPSKGTLPTHTPLFILFLVGTVLLVGALTYFPALALGPVAEHLMMVSYRRIL
jgi:K+-transporting ATPase ATPase A chain